MMEYSMERQKKFGKPSPWYSTRRYMIRKSTRRMNMSFEEECCNELSGKSILVEELTSRLSWKFGWS